MAQRRYNDEAPQYGILMSEGDFERLISQETEYRYELVDGLLYDMTGSSPKHSALAGQIEFSLKMQLGRSGPCRVHHEQYVAIPGSTPLVPDVVLTCDRGDWDDDKIARPFRIQSPLIIVEVLSRSTERRDRAAKFASYQLCPTLDVYILVSQYERRIEVYRRENEWQQEIFASGQTVLLDQLDLELEVDEIYEGVL
ncbi:MAG TPA: Uma2 family endonuclease [Ktedonobacteraceae bacterium]|nr:Uma2 family endonuclease [Ktedonobacteraceae bacterium]